MFAVSLIGQEPTFVLSGWHVAMRTPARKIFAKPPVYVGTLCDRDAFLHMAQNTVLNIMYRDLKVEEEWKRKELTDANC